MSGTCDGVFVPWVQRKLCGGGRGLTQRGVCPGASTGCGVFWVFSTEASVRAEYRRKGSFVAGVYPGGALSEAPSYMSSCKILAKSDNPRPSCSDLTN